MDEDEIARRFTDEGLDITVVGLGYIGCVLATILADQGQNVFGLELRESVVESVNKGRPPFYEPGLDETLRRVVDRGKLTATTDPSQSVARSDVIFVTVGTPIDRRKKVVFEYLDGAITAVGQNLSRGSVVVLKSTVPPLTTERRVLPLLERESGLVASRDFGLAFVPERTVEGRALRELRSLPKIVGGIDSKSTSVVATIVGLIGGKVIPVSKPRVAEAAKLFDNIYRDVNIALANELAIFCEKVQVDFVEAARAANNEYPRTHLLMAGPGVGGSCLTKDPYIFLQAGGNLPEKSLILWARMINDRMPTHVVELVADALREAGKSLSGSKIAVLGYAFKGNTDDTRNTPVAPLVDLLHNGGASTCIYDPYVRMDRMTATIEECLDDADCVVVATDHDEFRTLSLDLLEKRTAKPHAVVDTRHIFYPEEAMRRGFVYRGVGRPSSGFRNLD